MRNRIILIALVVLAGLMIACGGESVAEVPDVLEVDPAKEVTQSDLPFRIAVVPDENFYGDFSVIASVLEPKVLAPVELVVVGTAAEAIEGFASGEIHMLWVDGLTGIEARNASPGAQVILVRPEDAAAVAAFGEEMGDLTQLEGQYYHWLLSEEVIVRYRVHFPQRVTEALITLDPADAQHAELLAAFSTEAFLISGNEDFARLDAVVGE